MNKRNSLLNCQYGEFNGIVSPAFGVTIIADKYNRLGGGKHD